MCVQWRLDCLDNQADVVVEYECNSPENNSGPSEENDEPVLDLELMKGERKVLPKQLNLELGRYATKNCLETDTKNVWEWRYQRNGAVVREIIFTTWNIIDYSGCRCYDRGDQF